MLRHCPIPRFSSSGARRKMPTVCGKETSHVPPGDQPLDLADPKDVTKEQLPPQKVLKIFSINIIAQGLPFCRRRVSNARCRTVACFEPQKWKNVKGHFTILGRFITVVLRKAQMRIFHGILCESVHIVAARVYLCKWKYLNLYIFSCFLFEFGLITSECYRGENTFFYLSTG